MWLLHTTKSKLDWFTDCSCVSYAILSHRWEDDEITFADMRGGKVAKVGRGSVKMQGACRRAIEDGYDYIWIDTCCINKDSSAELSESINSMFQWYKAAKVCYAYLFDVDPISLAPDNIEPVNWIKRSEWFKRGWTLQELIAPSKVIFLDKNFRSICQKHESSDALSVATGIDKGVLEGGDFRSLSVAERMSWASTRQTTRTEDRAYSLLGLFDVSIPLLYGEGASAFRRLQEAIIQASSDHSILAWDLSNGKPFNDKHRSAGVWPLAKSPKAFEASGDIVSFSFAPNETREPYALTNMGLRISLPVGDIGSQTYALLNCRRKNMPFEQIAIPVLQSISGNNEYRRMMHPLRQVTIPEGRRFIQKSITLRNELEKTLHPVSRFWLRSMPTEQQGMQLLDVFPPATWNSETNVWTPSAKQLDRLLWYGWMRFAIRGQHELLLRLSIESLWSKWPTKLRKRGRVCAFTLVGSSSVSMATLAEKLLKRHTSETSKHLIEGHPGIRMKSKTKFILGEQTCVVDITMHSKPLFHFLGQREKIIHAHPHTSVEKEPAISINSRESESEEAGLSDDYDEIEF